LSEADPQPSRKKGELGLRVVSALVLLVAVLGFTAFGGQWFAAMCGLALIGVLFEFSFVTRAELPGGFREAMLASGAAIVAAWFLASPEWAFRVAALAIAGLGIAQFVLNRSLWASIGLSYAALPFLAMALLRGETNEGLHAILFVFACVFAADTFAYFVGRTVGGPKLAPKISPNKTWSGFLGGIAGSALVAYVVMSVVGYRPDLGLETAAVLLSFVSQLGDLFESWIKRRFGKKDSGSIIPGHGGLLDRIDGLIFACVAAWLAGIAAGGDAFTPGASGSALIGAITAP
jgi:phosphatidate cytidylyltransferase